jgi:hypothetical protein
LPKLQHNCSLCLSLLAFSFDVTGPINPVVCSKWLDNFFQIFRSFSILYILTACLTCSPWYWKHCRAWLSNGTIHC